MIEPQTTASTTESSVNDRTPTVSIGMPVYNGEKYIREALDSLLAQTFTGFELIISDNASTDATSAICQEYVNTDGRIRYVRQSENLGPIANFQFVLSEACGKYFMWAACDDVWDKRWLESLTSVLDQSGAGAAFARVLPINEKSELIEHIATKMSYRFCGSRLIRRLKFYLQFEGAGKANLFYALFNKKYIENINLQSYHSDYAVIYDLLEQINIEGVDNVYLYKRDHPYSAGNKLIEGGSLLYRINRAIFPIPFGLIKEYVNRSSFFEKIVIFLVYPYKLLVCYLNRLGRYV